MLVSFATMLMFQMLGSYRVARERVQAQPAGSTARCCSRIGSATA